MDIEKKRKKIEADIEIAIGCGMLLKDEAAYGEGELWIDDGYYFLTPKFRKELAGRILSYLHSQGCVLRVERELPDVLNIGKRERGNYYAFQQMLDRAGYSAVEPLIKERDGI